jgi:hypothetical protein
MGIGGLRRSEQVYWTNSGSICQIYETLSSSPPTDLRRSQRPLWNPYVRPLSWITTVAGPQ